VAAIVLASAPAAAASASAMMNYGLGLEAAVELGADDFKAAATLRDNSEAGAYTRSLFSST